MKEHILKCDSEAYVDICTLIKRCDVRRDDREFAVNDLVCLRETRFTGEEMRGGKPLVYTRREVWKKIIHIQKGVHYGIMEGFAALSLG